MKTFRLALILIAFVAATRDSTAGMINFTFAGIDMTSSDLNGTPTMGSGSFSFPDGATSVNLNNVANLNNLTGFSFSDTTNYKPYGVTTFSYGLTDVFFFSATLTPSGTLTSLMLSTAQKNSSDNGLYYQSEAFIVSSLAANQAYSLNLNHAGVLVGTITPAAVPEPTSIVLCGPGLVGALVAGRRRSVAG